MGLKSTTEGGEIVQVQGGHIIRATGRKDRHSKVFTAKGPRDRRVRLAAHTAIQFYDVQDRLGYDRPSKAVDWLINMAKASIDKLAELPPWDPMVSNNNNNNNNNNNIVKINEEMSSGGGENNDGSTPFYVPQCDSMRSFFPTNSSQGNNSNNISFQNYPRDLCLSLHTLHAGESSHQSHPGHDHGLFHGGFDGGWAQQQDAGRFTRLMGWDGGSDSGSGEARGGIIFNNSAPLMSMMTNYSQNQRGTLQSNYSPFGRGLEENQGINNNNNNNQHSISSIGYGPDHNFMGFYIPSQSHGDLHGGASLSNNRASSSSSSPDSIPH